MDDSRIQSRTIFRSQIEHKGRLMPIRLPRTRLIAALVLIAQLGLPALTHAPAAFAQTIECATAQCTVTFGTNGDVQMWTAPSGVHTVTITAVGGKGGCYGGSEYCGGYGASMQGTFSLAEGETLSVIVGGAGSNGTAAGGSGGGGGGGGSFVWSGTGSASASSLLIAAGGGGGGGSGYSGYDANTSTAGANGNNNYGGIGGEDGNGGSPDGSRPSAYGDVGAGGGLLSSGSNHTSGGGGGGGGQSAASGGAGGTGLGDFGGSGGFGGGGGG